MTLARWHWYSLDVDMVKMLQSEQTDRQTDPTEMITNLHTQMVDEMF